MLTLFSSLFKPAYKFSGPARGVENTKSRYPVLLFLNWPFLFCDRKSGSKREMLQRSAYIV
jgi:hypothetical protein